MRGKSQLNALIKKDFKVFLEVNREESGRGITTPLIGTIFFNEEENKNATSESESVEIGETSTSSSK